MWRKASRISAKPSSIRLPVTPVSPNSSIHFLLSHRGSCSRDPIGGAGLKPVLRLDFAAVGGTSARSQGSRGRRRFVQAYGGIMVASRAIALDERYAVDAQRLEPRRRPTQSRRAAP